MDRILIERVLRLIDRDLRDKLLPELQTPSARLQVDYMSRLLRWLAVQVTVADALESGHRDALVALLEQQSVDAVDAVTDYDASGIPVDALTAALRRVAGSSGGNANRALAAYIDLETRLVQALDPEGGSSFGEIYQGGRLGAEQAAAAIGQPVTDATLSDYLRTKFPGCVDIHATRVQPLPGGFGKDTILFEIGGGSPHDGPAVMRKDFLVPPGPGKVTAELPLLAGLSRLGVPVPEPLWAEPDATIFGGEFIVVRRVPGTNDVSAWSSDPQRRQHFADRLARILARIHSIAPADLGRDDLSNVSAADALREHMRSFYRLYRERATSVHPRIEAAFSWLFANLPADEGNPPVLVHGDIGFHNMLTQDGEVRAVLDWEFAHFGAAGEDLSYCRPFVETLLPWADFLAMYRAHGGRPDTTESGACYRVWGDLRNACMGVGAVGTLALSAMPDIRSAAAGLGFGPLCELQALRGIPAVAAG